MHDFIALELIDGQVQFSFSLGTDITRVQVSVPDGVSNGNFHEVFISYVNRVSTEELKNTLSTCAKEGKDIVACRRGGVSNKPPWAPGSDKTRGHGSFGPFTGELPNVTVLAITTYKNFKKKWTVHLTRFLLRR